MMPVKFWPYTSVVMERIATIHYRRGDDIDKLQRSLIDKFKDLGAYMDNKTVFEFANNGRRVFIGFADWTCSIGFNMVSY